MVGDVRVPGRQVCRQLSIKLSVHGLNALFNFRFTVTVSDTLLSGVATATAVHLAGLPPPPPLRLPPSVPGATAVAILQACREHRLALAQAEDAARRAGLFPPAGATGAGAGPLLLPSVLDAGLEGPAQGAQLLAAGAGGGPEASGDPGARARAGGLAWRLRLPSPSRGEESYPRGGSPRPAGLG